MEAKEGFIPLEKLPAHLGETYHLFLMQEKIDDIVDSILPRLSTEATCLQKQMIKERNRAMLKRMLKTIRENPYERYTFDIKK